MPLLHENKSEKELQMMKDWVEVRAYVEKYFGRKPDIQSMLFLIGVNEIGEVRDYEKEEKQDLMHIGMCTLLEGDYYQYDFKDAQGWPHYKELRELPPIFLKEQESLLKNKIIEYFKKKVFD